MTESKDGRIWVRCYSSLPETQDSALPASLYTSGSMTPEEMTQKIANDFGYPVDWTVTDVAIGPEWSRAIPEQRESD